MFPVRCAASFKQYAVCLNEHLFSCGYSLTVGLLAVACLSIVKGARQCQLCRAPLCQPEVSLNFGYLLPYLPVNQLLAESLVQSHHVIFHCMSFPLFSDIQYPNSQRITKAKPASHRKIKNLLEGFSSTFPFDMATHWVFFL